MDIKQEKREKPATRLPPGAKRVLAAFLTAPIGAAPAFADLARVVSIQENPQQGHTRFLLDTTPNDENNRADAYVDITTDGAMSMREFAEMIQVGDIIEYAPSSGTFKDGRYFAVLGTQLINLNGKNIYRIFLEDLEDKVIARLFPNARRAYEAQQSQNRRQSTGRREDTANRYGTLLGEANFNKVKLAGLKNKKRDGYGQC